MPLLKRRPISLASLGVTALSHLSIAGGARRTYLLYATLGLQLLQNFPDRPLAHGEIGIEDLALVAVSGLRVFNEQLAAACQSWRCSQCGSTRRSTAPSPPRKASRGSRAAITMIAGFPTMTVVPMIASQRGDEGDYAASLTVATLVLRVWQGDIGSLVKLLPAP